MNSSSPDTRIPTAESDASQDNTTGTTTETTAQGSITRHQSPQEKRSAADVVASACGREMTGAEALVLALLAEGVEVVFGYPGGAIMPVYDALHDYGDVFRHILVRHEQGAVHAAQGFARATRRPGVCMATSGPGATNLVTGIADAQVDSTPIVCITGQVASHLLGTDAFQETDVINVTAPITKWNTQVTRAEDVSATVARAFYVARTGRPGPVVIDITKDAQLGRTHFAHVPCRGMRSYAPTPRATDDAIQRAARLINGAQRPLIIAGQGVALAQAEAELRAFAERCGAPVAWTLLGLDTFPTSHPLSVGMVGMHGRLGANVLTNACDVLVAVGMRFDDRVTGDPKRYATQAQIIHVEIDAAEIGKVVSTAVPVLGDARDVLERMLPLLEARSHPEWLGRFRSYDMQEHERVARDELYPTTPAIRMGEVVRMVHERTRGEAVIVTDVGQHQMVASRYGRYETPRTSITSGGLGTMGFAVPAALGAAIACPEQPVIAIVGDGGFQMTVQELGTIAQTQAAVKIIVLNNEFLGMVRQWQELFFERRYAHTELKNPDFVRLASAWGIPGLCVAERGALPGALDAMLSHPGPFVLDVRVAREDNVFPMIPSGASVSEMRLP